MRTLENEGRLPAEITSRPLMTVKIIAAPLQKFGAVPYGVRSFVPIAGGDFEGPRLRGKILPGGGDWLLLRSDGVLELDLRRWARFAFPPLAMIIAGAFATLGSKARPTPAEGATPTLLAALCSPQVDVAAVIAKDPDVIRINAELDTVFAATVAQVSSGSPTSRYEQVTLLGKLLLNDKSLSVNRNVACETCHGPSVAQTGVVDIINRTIVAYPGSAFNLVSARKPQTYRYGAAFAPILHYDEARKTLVGGNFWDMRARRGAGAGPATQSFGNGAP
jgi:hypothetical protein